jgi:hypothetical protein
MQTLPARSVGFILTGPAYIAAHRSRDNRTLLNDDHDAWLWRSFAQTYRVLKNDACAISFYGSPKVDLFFAAGKSAVFHIDPVPARHASPGSAGPGSARASLLAGGRFHCICRPQPFLVQYREIIMEGRTV